MAGPVMLRLSNFWDWDKLSRPSNHAQRSSAANHLLKCSGSSM